MSDETSEGYGVGWYELRLMVNPETSEIHFVSGTSEDPDVDSKFHGQEVIEELQYKSAKLDDFQRDLCGLYGDGYVTFIELIPDEMIEIEEIDGSYVASVKCGETATGDDVVIAMGGETEQEARDELQSYADGMWDSLAETLDAELGPAVIIRRDFLIELNQRRIESLGTGTGHMAGDHVVSED